MKVCPHCWLNPNENQSDEQQKRESEYVKENGVCNACENEMQEDEEEVDTFWAVK